MILDQIREQASVKVFADNVFAGTLTRTPRGALFTYDSQYAAEARANALPGIAFGIPPQVLEHHVQGVNLHPFFAGVLPEGLRLKALRSTLKTSEDDLFSMFLALGENTIGDVYASIENTNGNSSRKKAQVHGLSEVNFFELFEASVHSPRYSDRNLDTGTPGVIPKLSASMISFPVQIKKLRRQYILKLETPEHPRLVENELFFMKMAADCGIPTPPVTKVTDRDGNNGLLVERFDRIYFREEKRFRRLHLEDACQFLNKYPQDKYRIPMREIAEGFQRLSTAPLIDIQKLIVLYSFSYLIGNGDLHGKNISLLRNGEHIGISPGYDLLTTLPYRDRTMALKLNEKDDNLRLVDLINFGRIFEIPERAIKGSVHRLLESSQKWVGRFKEIGFETKQTNDLIRTFELRAKLLGKS